MARAKRTAGATTGSWHRQIGGSFRPAER